MFKLLQVLFGQNPQHNSYLQTSFIYILKFTIEAPIVSTCTCRFTRRLMIHGGEIPVNEKVYANASVQ